MEQLKSYWNVVRRHYLNTATTDGRKRGLLLALLLLTIGVLSSPSETFAQADRYDAAAQFSLTSNPNGVWTYGWSTTPGGTLTPFSNNATAPLESGAGAVSYWNTDATGSDFLAVFANQTNQAVTFSAGTVVQPQTLVLHPAQDSKLAVVRFTAPEDGQYAVSATFRNLDAQAKTTKPVITSEGVALPQKILVGANSQTTYAKTFVLRSGDTVDFAVGNGGDKGDTFKDDAVQLTLQIDRTAVPTTPQLAGGLEGPLTDSDTTSTGDINLIAAFVDFSDVPGDPKADYGAIWDTFTSKGKLAEVFKAQSDGKANLTVTPVFSWHRMPQPLSYYFPSNEGWKYQDYTQDAANLYISDALTVTAGTVMVVVPPEDAMAFWPNSVPSGNHGIRWKGMRRIITIAPTSYSDTYTTLAHEMGHSFGLGELYPAARPYTHEVAGFDFMGDIVYATGFIGWHRHKFLWMDDARKAYLPTKGSYIIPLKPLSETVGINMVIVPYKGASAVKPDKVWVIEINQDIVKRASNDKNLISEGDGKKLVSEGDGVLIYTVETTPKAGKRELRLIQSAREDKWKNLQEDHVPALYKQGQVFSHPDSPMKMTIWGKSETGFVLEILVNSSAKLP